MGHASSRSSASDRESNTKEIDYDKKENIIVRSNSNVNKRNTDKTHLNRRYTFSAAHDSMDYRKLSKHHRKVKEGSEITNSHHKVDEENQQNNIPGKRSHHRSSTTNQARLSREVKPHKLRKERPKSLVASTEGVEKRRDEFSNYHSNRPKSFSEYDIIGDTKLSRPTRLSIPNIGDVMLHKNGKVRSVRRCSPSITEKTYPQLNPDQFTHGQYTRPLLKNSEVHDDCSRKYTIVRNDDKKDVTDKNPKTEVSIDHRHVSFYGNDQEYYLTYYD